MKVAGLKYINDYNVEVKFDDGVSGTIDLSELVNQGIFIELKDKKKFATLFSNGYSIAWSDELEIDAASIYAEITGKRPEAFFNANNSHSSN